ncbi:uncharacterized protein LOC105208221 isoform X2 [Solenopsis invicta]|uniref:uncharacterized protein LOC105208221 isoform X2 n=1 Tax=Solenopsis invicta TaxID=13686 RepID=UPI000E33F908|nr:uncharacterized protein LOC105208221 isoform X2 [Solenopsis invicta]
MKRLLLFALLIYAISAQKCVVRDKKEKKPNIQVVKVDDAIRKGRPDIQVIELDESSKESSEIVAYEVSDRSRRQAVDNKAKRKYCKKDNDCGPGSVCLANVVCVKGRRRTIEKFQKVKAKDAKKDKTITK